MSSPFLFALMSYPLASESRQLVVGQIYLVPTVNGCPVIGDPHTDNDHFNVTEEHYHFDTRFKGESNDAVRNRPIIERGQLQAYDEAAVTLKPFGCVRETPDSTIRNFGAALASLYIDYGHSEGVCGKCPHKGMPIQNGVCTGHRMQWLPDGTAKYKPPYTITIRGTNNRVVYEAKAKVELFVIDIVEEFRGLVIIDVTDRDGQHVSDFEFPHMTYPFSVGDQLKIGNPRR